MLSGLQKNVLIFSVRFFHLNPSCYGINLLTQMKSLRDEILLRKDNMDGLNLISGASLGFHREYYEILTDSILSTSSIRRIISFISMPGGAVT